MRAFTEFQRKCESILVKSLQNIGKPLQHREVGGEEEPYIQGEVGDCRIWIYLDGAEIQGRGLDASFEKQDYGSEDDLISAFLEALVKGLKQTS